jgi:hypothetical protein
VQPVTEVADELYALTPAEFTAARDERARLARQAGQRDEAAAIKKLARPTTSAWLVNQLSREVPDRLGRLVEVGEALGEAQRTLAGDRLRELSGQRRNVINELLPQAAEIASRAGQPASAVVMGEVRATLEAALADSAARAAVQSGRLTKPLAYAGLGEVDLAAALALPVSKRSTGGADKPGRTQELASGASSATDVTGKAPSGSRPSGSRPSGSRPSGSRPSGSGAEEAQDDPAAEARRAAETVEAAEAEVEAAARALETAERQFAGVAEQQRFLQRRIKHLERELAEAGREGAELARTGTEAERERDAAAHELKAAKRRLDRARRAAAKRG